MLDAITDFWKPSRKNNGEDKIDVASLQLGSIIGFGFIPQALLSGKRVPITGINTYEFADDRLTSFVLGAEGDTSVSLIVAEGESEKYIALSRRIPFAERMRVFDNAELLAMMENVDQKRLSPRNIEGEWGQWLASQYKKAIHGLKGRLMEGDFRNVARIPETAEAKEFTYTLLVSNNNEYALEIEQYADNRLEIYATVYRRISDIGGVEAPAANDTAATLPSGQDNHPAPKLESAEKPLDTLAPQPKTEEQKSEASTADVASIQTATTTEAPVTAVAVQSAKVEKPVENVATPAPGSPEETKPNGLKPLNDRSPEALRKVPGSLDNIFANYFNSRESIPPSPVLPQTEDAKSEEKSEVKTVEAKTAETPKADMPKVEAPKAEEKSPDNKPDNKFEPLDIPVKQEKPESILSTTTKPKELAPMSPYNPAFATNTQEAANQPVRAVSRQPETRDNDAVECELKVANRIIEEAIRNEIRLSDVIRRIVELPVAYPEAVQIPVTLSDEDYQLLAIRYGLPANDRNAIKAKIIAELNDFSGKK